jgi:hypothetical protein
MRCPNGFGKKINSQIVAFVISPKRFVKPEGVLSEVLLSIDWNCANAFFQKSPPLWYAPVLGSQEATSQARQ